MFNHITSAILRCSLAHPPVLPIHQSTLFNVSISLCCVPEISTLAVSLVVTQAPPQNQINCTCKTNSWTRTSKPASCHEPTPISPTNPTVTTSGFTSAHTKSW
ncbi:hypothetical protein JAAARDRAFT_433480 [Jaapia argillacea MUCL 33604]|uniref:Uncharacterized protein n=1 Tax=Jaapia argillacea MUCL 33604 TaxID=933084 RepID=A0A067PHM4_9AGAM|nr:hypothetical protein JAAARDRAFT_433480 [Jaapia argillacea MUCL 33604]